MGLKICIFHPHDSTKTRHTVQGAFGANWPVAAKTPVDPVRISLLEGDDRHLHAKAFEIVCRHGRIVLSGSANATMAALGANANIELCVAHIQRDVGQPWHLTPATAPMPSGATSEENEHAQRGVLRAVLKADLIHGSILTPFPPGAAAVSRLTASGLAQTGETVVDADGHFTVAARDVERDAWTSEPNGGGAAHHPEKSGEVSLASLLDPDRIEIPPAAGADSTGAAGWRRFMELLFASFRERREPIDGEGDGEDGPETNGDPVKPGAPPQRRHRTELDGAFVHFEKLLDLMLRGSDESRRRAFRLAHFICDRLAPETARVRAYLEKLIAAFLERPETLGDEEGIKAAILVWAAQLPNVAYALAIARAVRRRLLQLGAEVTGSMPDMNAVQGFVRALAPDFDTALWQHVTSIMNPSGRSESLRLAGGIAHLGPSFPWPMNTAELKNITAAERKRVKFLLRYSEACPCCNLVLSSAQRSRLREAGVARATDCCGRILLCEETLYVDLPDTPLRASVPDQRQARIWFDRGVPIAVVETALLLACLRRTARPSDVPPLWRIRSLANFQPVIEELLENPAPSGYLQYLRLKLRGIVDNPGPAKVQKSTLSDER